MKVDEQTDEYTAVGHILPKLITNSLVRMINYAESGLVKLKFQNTKLHEAINCVIRNAHASVKDEHISNPIKIWLAHAKERMDREIEKKRERNQRDQVRNNEPK
ncbi:hypothetical protein CAJAP_08492 [Camponotus japonicus]